jgi:type IV pilus assembly protein PilY1
MTNSTLPVRLLLTAAAAVLTVMPGSGAGAATLIIPDTPLFLSEPGSVPAINLLVMGRDHKLYYEAYNDASDLDGDGDLDVGYKPDEIDYFGYFDPHKCYEYSSNRFRPVSVTANKQCTGRWSGDFLNYVTTSRMDAVRKVLYGGYRYQDTATTTILERAYIPQDAHSWGKEYESVARDGYDISRYTPYSVPAPGTRHLFANTTILNTGSGEPRLRVLLSQPNRIWEWVAIERPVAGTEVVTAGVRINVSPTDFTLRVEVCNASMPEVNCKAYPSGNMKPTGLLHDYGENGHMWFGLLTGSYAKNTAGGLLRKNIEALTNEITPTNGQFTSTVGVVKTLDRLATYGFTNNPSNYTYNPNCGWITTRTINPGECQMWGNPIAEMLYESVRYFGGKLAPTTDYVISGAGSADNALLLPSPSWVDPYSLVARCSKPFATVISDVNPSYDTDQVPGSEFGSFTGDVPGLYVGNRAQTIWNVEAASDPTLPGSHFIGQSGATYDGAPTPKTVTSFGSIRGLAPEEPTKQGGYYSASVADYGHTEDIHAAKGEQTLSTFAVALASPLPKIEIPVGDRRITLVPFAKSVGGCMGVTPTEGGFQPTNTIVDFFVETITPTYGRFRVNFEDVEQGADHDMDAIVIYEYEVSGSDVKVTLTSEYAAGCLVQHMGYVISGTTADGTYLEVRDVDTWGGDGVTNLIGNDVDYFLDTPNPAVAAAMSAPTDGVSLPTVATRTFTAGPTPGATLLKNPLWYAAKWGGFKDRDANKQPNLQEEWDENGDGDPDNYFLVTNALNLGEQISKAFDEILARNASASSASVNSGTISSDTRIYQARFNSGDWTGELLAYPVNSDGSLGSLLWDAGELLPAADSRTILTINSDGTPVRLRWNDLDATRQGQLQPLNDGLGDERLEYLRGDGGMEKAVGGPFRDRSTKLGDIIASAPNFVGEPLFRYSDSLESGKYSAFRAANANRRHMVYAGANEGMLHGFDARTGEERLAFIPGAVFKNLHKLANPNYLHQYFVDGSPNIGDAFFDNAWHTVLVGGLNKGGQGVYALDITDPEDFGETDPGDTVLWEFTDAQDSDLGLTYSRPQIVRMHNGKWAAIFGNGYNNTVTDGRASATGNAVLYIVDIDTGALIRKIDTGEGALDDPLSLARPNGLATPGAVDLNGDDTIDYIYAGDLFGNLWKFDVSDTDAANWNVAYDSSGIPLPIFKARDASGKAQPITSRPVVGRGPNGAGMVVLFGTGKYLEGPDKILANLSTQTFYGIVDRNQHSGSDIVSGRAELVKQQILIEDEFTFGTETVPLRVTTANPVGTSRGWYVDLLSGSPGVPPPPGFKGEMVVADPILRNGRVIFTTLIPNPDPCDFGGSSWLMEMDAMSGARLEFTPFDNNDDGQFTQEDFVVVTIGGVEYTIPVSGKKLDNGIAQRPGILMGVTPGVDTPPEYKYQPGTSGEIEVTRENSGPNAQGRQSWRQIK